MSVLDPLGSALRRRAAGVALILATASLTVIAGPAGPAQAQPINPADFQQVDARQGRRRDGRADVHGRAARPLGPAHRPRRHAAPHRRRRQHHGGRHHPRLHPRRGGPAGRRRRPRASPRNRYDLPLLRAAAVHPGRRRARHRHRLDRVARRQPAVPVHPQRRLHAQHGERGDRPRRAGRPGHLLPRRRRHRLRRRRQPLPVHRRRHATRSTPTATRRSTSGPTATPPTTRSAPPATPTTCAARSCGSRSNANGGVHHPGRQPVRARHGEHPARDLRDGLPQPVPDERRQGHRRRLRRRLRPGRRHPSATRGPSGQVEFNRITAPGNYGWPYCTGTNTTDGDLQRVELRHRTPPARSTTAPAGRPTTRSATPACSTLPAAQPAWIRYGGDAGSPPEFGGGSESPMGGPVYRYDAANTVDRQVPAELRRALLRRRVRPRLDQADRRSTPTARRGEIIQPSRGPASRSWTWRSARTARCTSSTTAPATSTATRTRRCTASSTSPGGNRAPIAERDRHPDLRPGAADGDVLLGRLVATRGRRAHLLVGVRRRHAPRPRPTRRRPTPPTAPTPRR